MASYRRGHKRRLARWQGYGWSEAQVNVSEVVNESADEQAPAAAATVATPAVEPADVEPKPSGE